MSTSGSHSCKNNLRQLAQDRVAAAASKKEEEDMLKVIAAMTVNKGTGMSDVEWNEIVKTKVTQEREDELKTRNKIIFQRTSMRQDLHSQMNKEKELDSAKKTLDREQW